MKYKKPILLQVTELNTFKLFLRVKYICEFNINKSKNFKNINKNYHKLNIQLENYKINL